MHKICVIRIHPELSGFERLYPDLSAKKLSDLFCECADMWRRVAHNATMNEKQRQLRLQKTRQALAANVKALRLQHNWTQRDLADLIGVHRVTIMRLELAMHDLFYGEACLLADVFGVSIEDMRHKPRRGRNDE